MSLGNRPQPKVHDPDAVRGAIRDLSRADTLRLRLAADTLLQGFRIDPARHDRDDLFSEAIARTLAGDRKWRQGVEFVYHLIQVMRSIASDWRRRFVRRSEVGGFEVRESDFRRAAEGAGAPTPFDEAPTPAKDPEAALIAKQQVAAIKRLFADDPAASEVIACLELEMKGPEIQKRTGMSKREFVTTMQRIRHRARRAGAEDGP